MKNWVYLTCLSCIGLWIDPEADARKQVKSTRLGPCRPETYTDSLDDVWMRPRGWQGYLRAGLE